PASGGTGAADVLVDIEPRADDRRIAHAAGDLPGETARGSDAGHFALAVQCQAVDGTGRRILRHVHGPLDPFRSGARKAPEQLRFFPGLLLGRGEARTPIVVAFRVA